MMTSTSLKAQKSAGLFSRLKSDKSGIAMVEFALGLPLLVFISLGGMELTNYSAAKMRASQIALMVADNAGRVRVSIDETDIDEVMIGARLEGEVMNFAENGRVILSSLEHNGLTGSNEGQRIRWQRCFGKKQVVSSYGVEGAGTTNASLAAGMGPPGGKIKALTNMVVMFVELQYDYQPITHRRKIAREKAQGTSGGSLGVKGGAFNFNFLFLSDRTLSSTAAYIVRERTNQTITNTAPLTTAQKRTCDIYKAT
jgi:TadE-like protein